MRQAFSASATRLSVVRIPPAAGLLPPPPPPPPRTGKPIGLLLALTYAS